MGKLPVAIPAQTGDVAEIEFSADRKYETEKGVAFNGDPLICTSDGIFRVNDDKSQTGRIVVKAGEEIAVTSVIAWSNSGFEKTCGRFVKFTPEKDRKYKVVAERLGGKGISSMWTGIAFQRCEVSVYKESESGFERVAARVTTPNLCSDKRY